MRNFLFNTLPILFLSLCLSQGAYAKLLEKNLELDGNEIPVQFDTSTGEYALSNFPTLNLKLSVKKTNLTDLDCKHEKKLSKFKIFEADQYKIKRSPIPYHLQVFSLASSSPEIKSEVRRLFDLEPDFELTDRSNGSNIENLVTEFHFKKGSLLASANEQVSEAISLAVTRNLQGVKLSNHIPYSQETEFQTPFHIFFCDLINKKIDIRVTGSITQNKRLNLPKFIIPKQIQAISKGLERKKKLFLSSTNKSLSTDESQLTAALLLGAQLEQQGLLKKVINNQATEVLISNLFNPFEISEPVKITRREALRIHSLFKGQSLPPETNFINAQSMKIEVR